MGDAGLSHHYGGYLSNIAIHFCSGFTGYADVIGTVLRELLIAVLYSCHYLKLYGSCWPSHHYSVDICQTLPYVHAAGKGDPIYRFTSYADLIGAVLRELLIAHFGSQ